MFCRPIKRRRQSGYQWNMGNGIYLVLSSLLDEEKNGEKQKVNSSMFYFELLSFCPDKQVMSISNRMNALLNLLKP